MSNTMFQKYFNEIVGPVMDKCDKCNDKTYVGKTSHNVLSDSWDNFMIGENIFARYIDTGTGKKKVNELEIYVNGSEYGIRYDRVRETISFFRPVFEDTLLTLNAKEKKSTEASQRSILDETISTIDTLSKKIQEYLSELGNDSPSVNNQKEGSKKDKITKFTAFIDYLIKKRDDAQAAVEAAKNKNHVDGKDRHQLPDEQEE